MHMYSARFVKILLGFCFSVFVLSCDVWPNLCLKEQFSIKNTNFILIHLCCLYTDYIQFFTIKTTMYTEAFHFTQDSNSRVSLTQLKMLLYNTT